MDNCSDNVDMSYTEKTKIDKKKSSKTKLQPHLYTAPLSSDL